MCLKFALVSGILRGMGHCFLLPVLAWGGSSLELLGISYTNTFTLQVKEPI